MEIEVRHIEGDQAEVRLLGSSRNVEGTAIVFNKESHDLGGFKEIILPEAITGVIENSDIKAVLNHEDKRGILARSIKGKGSLNIMADNEKVRYSFIAPSYPLGDELLEGIKRGDIQGSSFAFRVAPGGEKIERRADGTYLRTITKIETIRDVSPCYDPVAYDNTTVAIRSLDNFKSINDGTGTGTVAGSAATGTDGKVFEFTEEEKRLRQLNNSYKFKNK